MKVGWLFIPLLLLLAPASAAAQEYYGTVAAAVHLPDDLSAETAARIAVRAGDTITPDNVRASIQALYDSGDYRYIEVDAASGPDGVELTFRATPHYFFSTIRLDPEWLLERPVSAYFRIPLGEKFSTSAVERIMTGTVELLENAGYFGASITPEYVFTPATRLAQVTLKAAAAERARVGAIRLQGGEQTFTPAELLKEFGISTGDRFLGDRIDAGAGRIREKFNQLGFLNTRILVDRTHDPASNTVDLQVTVQPGQFTLVQARGFDIPRSRLFTLIPVFEEGAVDQDLVEEGRARVVEYMQQQGYFQARTTSEMIEAPLDDAVQINYVIEPGERYAIRSIRIEGNSYFSAGEIRNRMQIRSAGLFSRGVFSPELMARDIRAIQTMYRNAGFEDAQVRGLQEGSEREFDVVIEIQEGQRAPVEELRFTGNSAAAESELRQAIALREGQIYTPLAMEEARNALTGRYHGMGFPDARIESRAERNPETGGVRVLFQVSEGERYRIGQILVAGNRTAEKIIHRNSNLYPETPYNPEAILHAQQRLYATGLFHRVEIVPLDENTASSRNLLIQVEDAKPMLLTYGFGFTDFEGPRGTIELSHNNLFGLDRTLSLRLNGSRKVRNFQATYHEPWLFNIPDLQGYASLLLETKDQRFFSTSRVDFSIQTVKPIAPQRSYSITASYQKINLQDIEFTPPPGDPDDPEPPVDPTGTVNIARLGASFIDDRRDDPINPSRGMFSRTTGQLASRLWGSDVNMISLFNQTSYFTPFKRGVLAGSTRVGWNIPYGGEEDLPIFEKYFAGGSTTLRGFGLDLAGPPQGGQMMSVTNLEYRIPLTFLPLSGIGGAVFYDTGAVFERPADFSLRQFTHTAGAGVRYQTPLGPVRLDFGFNLKPERDSRFHIFFTLGHAF